MSNAIQMNSGNTQNTPREAMMIYICINFFTKVDQLIIVPYKHRLQLKFEEFRWAKQALYKQNEIENNTVL